MIILQVIERYSHTFSFFLNNAESDIIYFFSIYVLKNSNMKFIIHFLSILIIGAFKEYRSKTTIITAN